MVLDEAVDVPPSWHYNHKEDDEEKWLDSLEMRLADIYRTAEIPEIRDVVDREPPLSTFDGIKTLITNICQSTRDTYLLGEVLKPYIKKLDFANNECESRRQRNRRANTAKAHPVKIKKIAPTKGQLILWLAEHGYVDGLKYLSGQSFMDTGPHFCRIVMDHYNCYGFPICKGVFSYSSTNLLGHYISEASGLNDEKELGVVQMLMDAGCDPTPLGKNSPLLLALHYKDCIEVIRRMAKNDADFGVISLTNQLQIPDALFVAIYANHSMIPMILMLGGMKIVMKPTVVGVVKNGSRKFKDSVCCELARFRGLLRIIIPFCSVLSLCDKCKEETGCKTQIPTLMSLSRVAYRNGLRSLY
ncbi:hypothetical protein QR680_011193 [Steinernema hermaphroditum]|uniref:SOCS box domain-containing protein n=1 Tax=Steinernema hermaphroditum TaxID=289476 RepID=A0AA39ISX4_9BILA|nr:hypothetical protein QR680_011193 [Steinernema hermaphroditum]